MFNNGEMTRNTCNRELVENQESFSQFCVGWVYGETKRNRGLLLSFESLFDFLSSEVVA